MNLSPQWARLLAQFPALLLLIVATASLKGLDGGQSASDYQGEHIHWKPVDQAQVRLDDKAPLAWNVYQPDKKDKKSAKKVSHLVLLLLGHRYLMLDPEARLVYQVPLKSLQARGEEFESEDPPANEQLVPSTDWSLRDVGPAELIRLTLGDYGRALEVSIPHPPDMRPFY
jgi:hypothetical protein